MLLRVVISAFYSASLLAQDFYRVATFCDRLVTTLSRCRKDAPAAPTFVNKALPTCIKIAVLTIGLERVRCSSVSTHQNENINGILVPRIVIAFSFCFTNSSANSNEIYKTHKTNHIEL